MGEHDEQRDERRWRQRPWLALLLQIAVMAFPIAVASAVGIGVVRLVPPAVTGSILLTWLIAGIAAMLSIRLIQPIFKRLMPLAWLLRLGMLFPGSAPSRFKIARTAGRIRDLEARLAHAREHGLDGDAEHTAETVLSLVTALTNHDRRTRGHAERVRVFTDLLTAEMGLPRDDQDKLRWAALLHDIGKLEVPEKVLNKASKPSKYEWTLLRQHPEAGDRIIKPLHDWLGEWADAALHHHERWDGQGYPYGLAGSNISLAGRVVSVADCYEVMTASRAYKRPMSAIAAREELVRCSGTQFDPDVVRAFLLIPLARLRWALGPFAWFAQLPIARSAVHHGHQAVARVPEAVAMGEAVVVSTAAITIGGAASAQASAVDFPGYVQEQANDQAGDALDDAFAKTPIGKGSGDSGGSGEGSGNGRTTDGNDGPSSSSSSYRDESTRSWSNQGTEVQGQSIGTTDEVERTSTSQQLPSTQRSTQETETTSKSNDADNEGDKDDSGSSNGGDDSSKDSDNGSSNSGDDKDDDKDDSGSSDGGSDSSGGSDGDSSGNGNGGGGPPSHAGPPDHVRDKLPPQNPFSNS